ncbi:MAG TPA: hypothetical protein VFH43_14325, partial [Candidatus Kapabacteria bacterium]|nr:hypothetical protein [Candidatus Kapabacteria bacterium]
LYPILGMPEWHEQDEWTRLGLWDVCQKTRRREIYKPMLHALKEAQRLDRIRMVGAGFSRRAEFI